MFQKAVATASTESNGRSPITEVEIAGVTGIVLMHMAGNEDLLCFGVTTAAKLKSGFIATVGYDPRKGTMLMDGLLLPVVSESD